VRALAAGPLAATLEVLDLGQNPKIDDAAAALLVNSPQFARLQRLHLFDTGIGLAGFRALTERFGAIVAGVTEVELTARAEREAAIAEAQAAKTARAAAPAEDTIVFADVNLKLIVIEALRERGLVPPFDREVFYRVELGMSRVPAERGGVDQRVLGHLAATPIPPDLASAIERLVWEGGAEVFQDVWGGWDGEDDTFTLHDLSGIEQLTELRSLKILYGAAITDWRPLTRAGKLEELFVCGGRMADLGQLAAAPSLRSIELDGVQGRTEPANVAAVEVLTARGVNVEWTD